MKLPIPTHNISNDEYHNTLTELSSSDLKKFYRKSGRHFEHDKLQRNIETPAMALGTAFHAMILEPDVFEESYVIQPEFKPTELDKEGKVKAKTKGWKNTTDYKDQLKNFRKANAGFSILTEKDNDMLKAMRVSFEAHPMYREYFGHAEGHNEATYVGDFKVRCDRICHVNGKNVIIDIKTTDDASPDAFKRKALGMDYDLSAALYMGVTETTEFIWAVQERDAPYSCCWYNVSDWLKESGNKKLNIALSNLREQELPMGGYMGYKAEGGIVDL